MAAGKHMYAGFPAFMPVVFADFAGNVGIQPFFFGQAPFAVCAAGNDADRPYRRLAVRRCQNHLVFEHGFQFLLQRGGG